MPNGFLVRLMTNRRFARPRWLGPEAEEGIKLATTLRVATLEGRTQGPWCHVANEGKLPKTTRAVLSAMGIVPGFTDYVFLGDGGGVIELKRPGAPPSSLSPAQRDVRDWCQDSGVRWAMCRSADEAEATLRAWGWLK